MQAEERAVRTQSLYRAVNESLLDLNEAFGALLGTFSVACECSSLDCAKPIELPVAAYRELREAGRFVVLPEHVDHRVDRIVARESTHTIVELRASGAEAA